MSDAKKKTAITNALGRPVKIAALPVKLSESCDDLSLIMMPPYKIIRLKFGVSYHYQTALLTLYPRGVYHISMIADIKRRALHRSKILQGQLKGLEKMIDKEDYCMDIIIQSLAIQKSLSSLNKLIVENHLLTHIKEHLSSGDEKIQSEAINELLGLYELTHIRGKQ